MIKTIDMQDLRYLKLFSKITRIQTKYCFMYNNVVVFAVPRKLIPVALGKDIENLKKMGSILKKRVRVVAIPNDVKDAKEFIKAVIAPVEFSEIEITDDEIVLTAGSQNKAALIGRNKRRLLEMKQIITDFFGRSFRII